MNGDASSVRHRHCAKINGTVLQSMDSAINWSYERILTGVLRSLPGEEFTLPELLPLMTLW